MVGLKNVKLKNVKRNELNNINKIKCGNQILCL